MPLIWRGWGVLVPILVFFSLVLAQQIANTVSGEGTYERHTTIIAPLAVLPAAAVLWWLGRRLNQPQRVLVDAATGQTVRSGPGHTFWFIRMEYWAVIVAAAAVATLLIGRVT